MSEPTVKTNELSSIEAVFGMGNGYVLDFNNRTFEMFFADFGIDIYEDPFEGSKANRMRAFLRTGEPSKVADVLEALLERRAQRERRGSTSDEEDMSPQIDRIRSLIARLRGIQVSFPETLVPSNVLSLAYVHELAAKTDQRLAASDYDGAITTARTMLEAVLRELEQRLVAIPGNHKGDLQAQFKAVEKPLWTKNPLTNVDENFVQVVRGLVQVVNGLAPIRNRMSDGHPREHEPAPHHAHVVTNASITIVTFLIEDYIYRRDMGLLPAASPALKKEG